MALFRKEAIENRRQRLWGEVIVIQPLSFMVLTALLMTLVGAGVLALIFGSYARTETAAGFLVPDKGAVRVYAPQIGVVNGLAVEEGSAVIRGEPLMTVVIEQQTAGGDSAQARSLALIDQQISMLSERITIERTRADVEERRLEKELASLTSEVTELKAQRRVQDEITASAEKSFSSIAALVEQGLVARSEYEQRRQNYLSEQQRARQINQQIVALERERDSKALELERLPSELSDALALIENEISELRQRREEIESRRGYTLVAPIDGRVAALQASNGRLADPKTPLMVILPESGALEAELYVPSRAVGFVREGQEVRLLYDAFPYQRFGSYQGVVKSVTKTILAPSEVTAPFELSEAAYRVTVALNAQTVDAYGEAVPLQPGMTLRANIVLERQSLFNWLIEPLRALGNKS